LAVRSYADLVVWQKAMDLVVEVYALTRAFPGDEKFGLTSQLRRAAVSVPSNIAEGEGRHSGADFKRFLAIAHGSLCETETQLQLSERLGYADSESVDRLLQRAAEVGRMIQGLRRSIGS